MMIVIPMRARRNDMCMVAPSSPWFAVYDDVVSRSVVPCGKGTVHASLSIMLGRPIRAHTWLSILLMLHHNCTKLSLTNGEADVSKMKANGKSKTQRCTYRHPGSGLTRSISSTDDDDVIRTVLPANVTDY
jgi:hypothetical protein